jgi:uncharacterized protein (TIGR04206 family)
MLNALAFGSNLTPARVTTAALTLAVMAQPAAARIIIDTGSGTGIGLGTLALVALVGWCVYRCRRNQGAPREAAAAEGGLAALGAGLLAR